MTHEYGDPLSDEALEAAVRHAMALHRAAPAEPLERQVEVAVRQQVCSCAVDIEDRIEGGRSGLHSEIVREVQSRVEGEFGPGADAAELGSVVDIASAESFPASDPPAWIWRHPGN